MSNLDPRPDPVAPRASVVRAVDVIEARKAAIGDGTEVRRLLPTRALRTIGAWCFLDHYGPDDVSGGPGMRVPPHPHTGLQTASWLFDGLVLHRDSLGSEDLIRPGELNLMTSGRAIAHSEESPDPRPPLLHGIQLWIALPDERRFGDPGFAHHADLPVSTTADGARVTVVVGEHRGERSPARVYTPLVGLEVMLPGPGEITLPAGVPSITLSSPGPNRFFVVGGIPLGEKLVMWGNFVGRTSDDIVTARNAWVTGEFGPVRGYAGDPLPAPPLPPGELKARLCRGYRPPATLPYHPAHDRCIGRRIVGSRSEPGSAPFAIRTVTVSSIRDRQQTGVHASNLYFRQLARLPQLTDRALGGFRGSFPPSHPRV